MSETNIDTEAALNRAGANVSGPISGLIHLVRRYPLGAAGAVIVAMVLRF